MTQVELQAVHRLQRIGFLIDEDEKRLSSS